jgi:hypothetical protein
MAEPWDDQLLSYQQALGIQRANARQQNLSQMESEGQQLAVQDRDIRGKRALQADKGGIDAALQGQSIAGQRQVAADQYGYNWALQGQQGDIQGRQNEARFLHDDELFEREQSGRLATQHLQQIEEERQMQFQAGVQKERDATQFTHQAALSKMAADREEALQEILQRNREGTLGLEHRYKAEDLQKEEEARQQLAFDTHVATGIQKGVLELAPADQQKIDQIDQQLSDIMDSQNLDDQQKAEVRGQMLQRRLDVQRRAKPKAVKSQDWAATVNQFDPDPQMKQFYTPDKNGKPEFNRAKASYVLGVQKLQFEQAHPKQSAAEQKAATPAGRLQSAEQFRKAVGSRLKDEVARYKEQIAAHGNMTDAEKAESVSTFESAIRPSLEKAVAEDMRGDEQQQGQQGNSASTGGDFDSQQSGPQQAPAGQAAPKQDPMADAKSFMMQFHGADEETRQRMASDPRFAVYLEMLRRAKQQR